MTEQEATKLSTRLGRVYRECDFPWGTALGAKAAFGALGAFEADEVRRVVDLWVREVPTCPMPGELRGAVLCARWLDPQAGVWRGE